MGDREITVYVFKEDRHGRKPMWTAYTLWANPAWTGCRVVKVVAKNGTEAKRIAIAAEKARDAAEAEAPQAWSAGASSEGGATHGN